MSSSCAFFVSLLFTSSFVIGQDTDKIGFPEVYGDESLRPADNREPIFMPNRCSKNEILYPGNVPGDYTCDCRPGYVYHPEEEECFAMYEQGPCSVGDYIVLPQGKSIPVCAPNICHGTAQVLLSDSNTRNRKCVTLGKACDINTMRIYGVNATTLKVACLEVPTPRVVSQNYQLPTGREVPTSSVPPATLRPLTISNSVDAPCFPGCKRHQQGKC